MYHLLISSVWLKYVSSIWHGQSRICGGSDHCAWPEVTTVTRPEVTSVTCPTRKYVMRMRNRKLPHIRPSGALIIWKVCHVKQLDVPYADKFCLDEICRNMCEKGQATIYSQWQARAMYKMCTCAPNSMTFAVTKDVQCIDILFRTFCNVYGVFILNNFNRDLNP
jgi:hypothetical protein